MLSKKEAYLSLFDQIEEVPYGIQASAVNTRCEKDRANVSGRHVSGVHCMQSCETGMIPRDLSRSE